MRLLIVSFVLFAILLNVSFGILLRRIVRGFLIEITKAPYQISLLRNGVHDCGGSLISESFVVTAAHCVFGRSSSDLKVRVGSTMHNESGLVIDVDEIHSHPKYNDLSTDYDYAVLKLAAVEKLPEKVEFIKLPEDDDPVAVGEKTLVSGWGTTLNISQPNHLLWAIEPPILDIDKCREGYVKKDAVLTDRMICAGFPEGGADACRGDSGGPMKRQSDGVLIGIVSWGIGCGQPELPGIYAKVSYVRSWIRNITGI